MTREYLARQRTSNKEGMDAQRHLLYLILLARMTWVLPWTQPVTDPSMGFEHYSCPSLRQGGPGPAQPPHPPFSTGHDREGGQQRYEGRAPPTASPHPTLCVRAAWVLDCVLNKCNTSLPLLWIVVPRGKRMGGGLFYDL